MTWSCATDRPSACGSARRGRRRRAAGSFCESLSPREPVLPVSRDLPALTPIAVRALVAQCPDAARRWSPNRAAGSSPSPASIAIPRMRDRAEVAFAVADALQGHGIGTRLLEHLAASRAAQGIETFDAYVLGDNRRMLDVFRDSGFAVTTAHRARRLPGRRSRSSVTAGVRKRRRRTRSQTAATASMKAFFEPRVVAVIGANRERGKIGSEILHNLMAAGFTGAHRRRCTRPPRRSTASRAYPRVDRHSRPDRSRGRRGPGGAGPGGRRRLHREGRFARSASSAPASASATPRGARASACCSNAFGEAGCRLIGPNCMGLLNTDPAVRPERDVLAGRIRRPATSRCRRRAARSAWRSSTTPGGSTSASPASSRSATRPTCRATI